MVLWSEELLEVQVIARISVQNSFESKKQQISDKMFLEQLMWNKFIF